MLFNIGLNHKTTPVEVRERLAIPSDRVPEALDVLRKRLPHSETVVVSTCNRVEVYAWSAQEDTAERITKFMADAAGAELADIKQFTYVHTEADAIRHLFSVTAGLDSMVVGETQINSQIKQAYSAASEHGTTGKILNTLFQRAFAVAKEVYRKSAITDGKVSVSSVAADLAARIFASFDGQTVMVVGAGETGELALRHICELGRPRVVVANRTLSRADAMAQQFGGRAIALDDMPGSLSSADIVICCTASPDCVLTREMVERAAAQRRRAPMLIVDIAVPRDVDASAADVEGVYLYNVDDLEQIVSANLEARQNELRHCMAIVDKEVAEFVEWLRADRATPTIQALMEAIGQIKQDELDRLRPKLNGMPEPTWQLIVQMADRLASKIVHHPAAALREQAKRGEHWYTQAARTLFGLGSRDMTERHDP